MRSIPSSKFCLAFLPLFYALPMAMGQQDGTWIGATTNAQPTSNYTNTANWAGGIVAGGTDALATYNFNPISDNGTLGSLLAGATVFNAPQTLGGIVFNDTDGFGSATIGYNVGTELIQNLTLDTSTGIAPTLTTGFLFNAQSGGKKVVINANILGNDGMTIRGPGFIGFRSSLTGASTISGALTVEGGLLQIQSQFANITSTTVRGGSTLDLEFGVAGANSTNRIGAGSTLTLGGAGGGGVVVNVNAVATTSHSQTFAGVTLGKGASQIIAVTNTNVNMAYDLGAITPGSGAALNFAKGTAAGTGTFTVTNGNTNGIIGGWATISGVGSVLDFASNNGSNQITATTAYTANAWAAGNNTNVTATQNITGATTNSLRFNTANPFRLDLTGTNTVSTGGIISVQQSPVISGGTLTSGGTDLITHVLGGILRIGSTISDGTGPVAVVKALGGTLQIEGNNNYTGGTVVGMGTVIVGKGPLGGTTGTLGSGPVTLSANNTGVGNYSPNGVLAFNRSGTTTVTNAINSTEYGGGFLANFAGGGTLILNQAMRVGGYIQQAGTTKLDFNAVGAPTSQIIDGSFTSTGLTTSTTIHTARLTGRNGTLQMVGKDGANSVQTFALTDVFGTNNYSVTAGSGGTATLDFGVFNRLNNNNDGGGTIALTLGAGASAMTNFGTPNTIISDAGVAYVTVNGSDWGAKDATVPTSALPSTPIVAGSSIAGFYTATAGTGLVGGVNADYAVNDTVSGAVQTSSLRFNAAAAGTITLNAGGTLRPSGILVTPNVGANTTTIDGTGDLRSNTGIRDLPIIQNNTAGKLVISAPIVNFDATNLTGILKSGAGELELTSAGNTATGRMMINEGTVRLSGTGQLGVSAAARTASIFVRGGELIIQDNAKVYSGTFTSIGQRAGENGTLTLKNNAIYDISADFNIGDVNAKGTLNISDTATLTTKTWFIGKAGYAEGVVNQTGGTVIAGNTPGTEFNLGGNSANDTAASGTYNMSGNAVFNPVAQAFQVGRYGNGVLNLSGTASITGTGFHGIGRFNSGTGTVTMSGNSTYNVAPGGAGANIYIVGEVGRGTLNISDNATLTAKNMAIALNGGYGVVNQTGGIVDLVNTAAYTQTSAGIQAGVAFGIVPAPVDRQPDHGGAYNLDGGVLKTFGVSRYTGSTADAQFNFDGGTIQAKGDNATFLQGLTAATVEDGGAKIDSNGFAISIGQALQHDATLGATADGGLTKLGTGTLSLITTNGYTGTTTVSAGTLVAAVPGNIADTATNHIDVRSSASLTGNITASSSQIISGGGTITGDISLTGAGTISPGDGGTGLGTLTTSGSVTLNSAAKLTLTINDNTAGTMDTLANSGMFSANGASLLVTFYDTTYITATNAGDLAAATRYTFVTGAVDSTTFGNTTLIPAGDLTTLGLSGSQYEATFGGQRFWLEVGSYSLVPIAPVPEPAVMTLLLAMGGLSLRRRR